jgi:predicted alternative tryptophan synthase beta-subunit
MKPDRGARSNVITLPASELPTNWYNVLPDLPALRELPEVQA